MPLAAQVACTPVVAAISGQVSLVAVGANLLAAPAVAPATVLGLSGGLLGLLWSPLGVAVAAPAAWSAGWIIAVARWGAAVPTAAVDWGTGPVPLVLLTVLCLLAVAPRPAPARPPGHDPRLHRPPPGGDAGPAPDPGLATARLGAGDVRRRAGRRARPARRSGGGGGRRRRTRARTDRRLPRPSRGHRRAAPRPHPLPRRPRRRGGGGAGRSGGGAGRGHGAARPARGRQRCGARGRPRPGPGGVRPHAADRRGDAADGVAPSRRPPGRRGGERAQQRQRRPRSPRWAGCGSC